MIRSALVRLLVAFATALVAFSLTRGALAAPEVHAELDAETIGVGEPVQLTLTASSDGPTVEGPDPGAPASVRADQTSSGPMHSISIINGVRSEKRGLRTSWMITASKVGVLTLRPSVMIGGTRVKAQPITVRVVPAGKAPRPLGRRIPDPMAPFDPFKGMIEDLDVDDLLRGRLGAPVTSDPGLSQGLQAPRGKLAFLHATVDKPNAVVGEQVTYSVYLYVDAEQSEPRFDDVHEAGAKDFLRNSILPEDQAPKMLGHTTVGGRLWAVKLLRQYALFPLHAGRLPLTPMQLRVSSGRTVSGTRESERLFVDVAEPSANGRPPGYVIGDVGKYKLSATVMPREVDVGGAVTVEVTLEGTGNLPGTITPPPRKGVEWLPPEVKSNVAPNPADGRVGGTRNFVFVVRAREPGNIDLGELTLPFYDPDTGKYDVARAPLGTLTVRGTAAKTDDNAARPILEGLPKPYLSPEPPVARTASFVEKRSFWWAWGAPPGALFAYILASALVRRARARRTETKENPKSALKAAQSAVDHAIREGDPQKADAAMRRFVETALEQRLGVSLRALDLDRLGMVLKSNGVGEQGATELVHVLRNAETARFAPGGATMEDARARFAAAKRIVEAIPPKASSGAGAAAAAAAIMLLLLPSVARAQADNFTKATKALEQGKPEIAITELEVLADRGVLDAHASFDRGLAYAERVRLGGAQSGDLGRAVHGFEEARRLSGDAKLTADAERALYAVRAEIARERARGEAVELESHSFEETIARLGSATGWGILACVASLLASLGGAAAWQLRGKTSSGARRVQAGAVIVACIGAPLAIASAFFARDRALDDQRSWAVVITPESRARLTGSVASTPMPEGAIVEVTRTEAGRVEVRWGSEREWLSRAAVRLLVTRP
jgi:hypothetical protein